MIMLSSRRNSEETTMDWDEPPKTKPKTVTTGEELSALSVGELEHRITLLEVEIERTRVEVTRKKAHSAAASALFKSR
jgi:uncharacterized small protein (DUF1192 family)